MTNLLTQPVFSSGRGTLTLPGLLASLSQGIEPDLRALQAHQAHTWHTFLVQLAALALEEAGTERPWTLEEDWREGLLALAEEGAWCLDQPDLSRPAFLQPPILDGAEYKSEVETPDELGLLMAAKNHDVKRLRVRAPGAEHWVYALVALQTSVGFGGAGNYGISRMNGGTASRPVVGFYAAPGWAARFREDLARVRACEGPVGSHPGGHRLLWLLPWDSRSQLEPAELHPLFIEVARRVRLIDGRWRRTTTKAARVSAKALNGVMGDPWVPIRRDGKAPSALNVQRSGWRYDTLVRLLTGELVLPGPMRRQPEHEWLVCATLAAGQGKTLGFHERSLELPSGVFKLGQVTDSRLAERARSQVDDAAAARRRALLPALKKLFQGDQGLDAHLAGFTTAVDDAFFPALWEGLPLDDQPALTLWRQRVRRIAVEVLEGARRQAPRRGVSHLRIQADAERLLWAGLTKHLPLPTAEEADRV